MRTPEKAQRHIREQIERSGVTQTNNLEELAIMLVGTDIYEKFIKGYTEKQCGRRCSELPPWIIKRLPMRPTYNNNYYFVLYQGIPEQGCTALIERLLEGAKMRLSTDYLAERKRWNAQARRVIYTEAIDAYFAYCYDPLAYRSMRFETCTMDVGNYQGVPVMNYTDAEIPYARMIEHRHFCPAVEPADKMVVSYEYREKLIRRDQGAVLSRQRRRQPDSVRKVPTDGR